MAGRGQRADHLPDVGDCRHADASASGIFRRNGGRFWPECARLRWSLALKSWSNAVGFGLFEAEKTVSGDEAQLSHVPLGRPGSIDEAVAAVLFLCDPMNSYTTGQMLVVDGGWSAGYGRNF